MKDIISILQSRIAMRENEIATFESGFYDGRLTLVDGEYIEARPLVRFLAKQQKEDKRILAEIIKLRRDNKALRTPTYYISPEDSFEIVLDKSVDEWAAKFMKDNEEELNRIAMNFVEARLGER